MDTLKARLAEEVLRKGLNLKLVLIAVLSLAFIYPIGVKARGAYKPPGIIALEALSVASHAWNVPVKLGVERGFPRTVSLKVLASGTTPTAQARNFLNAYKALYSQDHPDVELRHTRTDAHMESYQVVRFHQFFRGLQVFGAEMTVHLETGAASGQTWVVLTAGGLLVPAAMGYDPPIPAEVDTVPAITAKMAEDASREAIGCLDAAVTGKTRLMLYDPGVFGEEGRTRLVWRVTLGGCDAVLLLVDANTGEVAYEQSLAPAFDLDLEDANGGNMTDTNCFNPTTMDDWIGDESGLDIDYHGDADAVTAWWGATYTYWTYHNLFGRDSWDNDDGELEVYIHAVLPPGKEPNARGAAWCGIEFSTGWPSIDILAHEFTHMVIHDSIGYYGGNQRGAINESLCDTIGAVVDPYDWLHGEDRTGGQGAIRNMKNPSAMNCGGSPCPDRYSKYVHTSADDGGVHMNCNILNKAFYLMADGGSFNNRSVTGMGRNKMGKLAYILAVTAPSNATFFSFRDLAVGLTENAWIRQAWGFTAQDTCTVRNAFRAVEIGCGDADCDGIEEECHDTDKDGLVDAVDNCPFVKNYWQDDIDSDGIGDACDTDNDNDGIPDSMDPCWMLTNDFGDPDKDGVPNCMDDDDDGDGTPDDGDGSGNPWDNPCSHWNKFNCDDNCRLDPNPFQYDGNLNGFGDACDPDHDGDGKYVEEDNCTFVCNPDQADADGDGIGDACDKCPNVADNMHAYTRGFPELGIDPAPYQPDSDGDGIPDACDGRNFGSVAVLMDSALYSELNPFKPNGRRAAFKISSKTDQGSEVRLPFPACATADPDGPSGKERVEVVFIGVPSAVSAWVEDGMGRPVAWGRVVSGPTPLLGLRFKPRCSEDYFLVFRIAGGFTGTAQFTGAAEAMVPTGDNPWTSSPAAFEEGPEPLPDGDRDGLYDDIDHCPSSYDPTNECRIPCDKDFDRDGDVDGKDLATLVNGSIGGIVGPDALADFAGEFGRNDCE
jgi:Zn-dependent metalloprotease